MSAQITFEITKYTPEGTFNSLKPDNDLSFHLKTDNKIIDNIIQYNNRTSFTVNVPSVRKELKVLIRMIKNGVTQGLTEFVISQLTFLKRDEKITKTLLVNDLVKKNNLGKLTLKVRINYIESQPNNQKISRDQITKEYVRSSSATPIDSKKNSVSNYYSNSNVPNGHGSGIKNIKSIINSVNSNFNTNFAKYSNGKSSVAHNKNYSTNVNGSAIVNKSLESIKLEEEKEEDIDKSRIDTFFDEDKLPELDNIGYNIAKFVQALKEKFLLNSDENVIKTDEDSKENCKNIIDKLFELQSIYYDDYNKVLNFYQEFKKFLVNYSENYRNLMKKSNRLNEAFESISLKNEFSNFINREENRRINESLNINRKEIKIYKHIFGIEYQAADVLKYRDNIEKKKYENRKKSMIKALKIIAKNPDKYEKLDESKKEMFISMAAKFCIDIKLRVDLEESTKEIKSLEENNDQNKSMDEKSSLHDDSKVNESNHKDAPSNHLEKEMVEENVSLGFRETTEIHNLENNLENNCNNNSNANSAATNSNLLNNISSNNKSNLSIINEEKEVLSNSLKNNFSGELVCSSKTEKKIQEQNIHSFVNNEKETNINSVNTKNKNSFSKDNSDQFNIQAKNINNCNNNRNSFNEITPTKQKAEHVSSANKHKKRLTIVDSKTQDDVDEKLDNYLVNTYNKKKMSFIPMRRVSENNYEFGSQRIEIKIDDEIIRVKTGAGYVLLDKYIDVYGPQEENLMIQACFGKDKGVTITTGHGNKNKKTQKK